jgi:histone deacetylase complex regulatory component SIN3
LECILQPVLKYNKNKPNLMAKKTIAKENPVTEALRKLREEESELIGKLRTIQEAIGALETVLDKSAKKSSSKESLSNTFIGGEGAQEPSETFQ